MTENYNNPPVHSEYVRRATRKSSTSCVSLKTYSFGLLSAVCFSCDIVTMVVVVGGGDSFVGTAIDGVNRSNVSSHRFSSIRLIRCQRNGGDDDDDADDIFTYFDLFPVSL